MGQFYLTKVFNEVQKVDTRRGRFNPLKGGIYKKYSKAERFVIGQQIYEGHLTKEAAATEYGVSIASISNWIRAYREECQTNDEEKTQLELMEEVCKLRQEKAELEKENDFPKKVAAFFAKKIDDYSFAAEPPVRCGVSHHSGPTEPPLF